MNRIPLIAASWACLAVWALPECHLCAAPLPPKVDPPASALSVTAGPVLQNPSETSVTVSWFTDHPAVGHVEYGPHGGKLETTFAVRHGLIEANRSHHKVELRGLQPGTCYRYRAVSRRIKQLQHWKVEYGDTVSSPFHEFRTLDTGKTNFSFVVFNDLHDHAPTLPELLKVNKNQPYDFALLNGDIVSFFDDEKQISSVLGRAADCFASKTPLIWVRGNHETRGRLARSLPDYLGLPGGRFYHSFRHGPVFFLILDAGEDKKDSHPAYGGLADFSNYRREQAEWLKTEVRTDAFRNAPYRVVICHMPFAVERFADPARYPEKGVFTGMEESFALFGEILERAGTDLMISGHMHHPAIIDPAPPRHGYPIVIGGDSRGNGRTLLRADVSAVELAVHILFPDGSTFGVCRVKPRR